MTSDQHLEQLAATGAQIYRKGDPEPDLQSGAIVVVNYGDYRSQEVWVRSGANIGNWYCLGNEFGVPKTVADNRSELEKMRWDSRWVQPPGTLPLHPRWEDILDRGVAVLLTPGGQAMWEAGWRTGRQRLGEEFQNLIDWGSPDPADAPSAAAVHEYETAVAENDQIADQIAADRRAEQEGE